MTLEKLYLGMPSGICIKLGPLLLAVTFVEGVVARRRFPAGNRRVDDSAGGRPEQSVGMEEVCRALWCERGAIAGPSALLGSSRRKAEGVAGRQHQEASIRRFHGDHPRDSHSYHGRDRP